MGYAPGMPRSDIEIDLRLEEMHVLDENGDVDEDLDPGLDRDELIEMARVMLLARRFDERRLKLQQQGRIGTFAPVIGQEASQVGTVSALADSDWVVPSYRESAVALWRGASMTDLLLYDAGFNEGAQVEPESRDLPIAIPVGTQLPHAAGIGYVIAMRHAANGNGDENGNGDGSDVVMTFFGDGATSEGDVHEALNLAALRSLPVVFVCQNNQWAISTPVAGQTASATLAQKAVAYGMPGLRVDGNDILATRVAAAEAVARARAGDGPTFVECVTYRMAVHTTADDPSVYRDEDEVEQWKRRDPIDRLRTYMSNRDLAGDDDFEQIESSVSEQVADAVEQAEARFEELGDPAGMFDHVWAEPPPYVEAQRREVERRG